MLYAAVTALCEQKRVDMMSKGAVRDCCVPSVCKGLVLPAAVTHWYRQPLPAAAPPSPPHLRAEMSVGGRPASCFIQLLP